MPRCYPEGIGRPAPAASASGQLTTVIIFVGGEASNRSVEGQVGQLTPSAVLFGSPVRANAPMLRIIVSDSATRPGWLAVVNAKLAYSEGPKLPNTNHKSNP